MENALDHILLILLKEPAGRWKIKPDFGHAYHKTRNKDIRTSILKGGKKAKCQIELLQIECYTSQ